MAVHLRELKKQDASFMLEWMQDRDIIRFLEGDFDNITIEDCEKFIFASAYKISRRDFAVADENDEYMGFVALKDIDDDEKSAEISIVLRRKIQGKGAAKDALKQLIRVGFYGMRLNVLYCYTKIENNKAMHLFERLGFIRDDGLYNDNRDYRFILKREDNNGNSNASKN